MKYRVDLLSVATAFPEMIKSNHDPSHLHYRFSILSIVREEKDEDSYLLPNLSKKAIRYNFEDESFKKLHDFEVKHEEVEFKVHDNLGTKPISKEPKFPISLIEIEAISQTTFKGPVAACQSALSHEFIYLHISKLGPTNLITNSNIMLLGWLKCAIFAASEYTACNPAILVS
ncbi:hypothetical protein Q3G72_005129 [Acer saccharum]|nr:hypothetical protein Q3G72_005129 [Acer saccharum]